MWARSISSAAGAGLLLAALWGCGNDTKPPVQATPTPVQPEPASPEPVVVPEPASDPGSDADVDTCQAECVQRNQMRAVAAEQIETDCAAECAAATDPQ